MPEHYWEASDMGAFTPMRRGNTNPLQQAGQQQAWSAADLASLIPVPNTIPQQQPPVDPFVIADAGSFFTNTRGHTRIMGNPEASNTPELHKQTTGGGAAAGGGSAGVGDAAPFVVSPETNVERNIAQETLGLQHAMRARGLAGQMDVNAILHNINRRRQAEIQLQQQSGLSGLTQLSGAAAAGHRQQAYRQLGQQQQHGRYQQAEGFRSAQANVVAQILDSIIQTGISADEIDRAFQGRTQQEAINYLLEGIL